MTTRAWLIVFLTIWLFLAILRQVFDLIGRLWIPVAFNLLQIVCCLTGLFGAIQLRISLLVALSISTIFSIAQNVLLCLWYLGVFGDRNRPILSGGLPYSFSFFLRFTPGCESHFDLKQSHWVQSPCPLPYFHIEAAQAIIHMFIATVTLFLSIALVCSRKRKSEVPPKQLSPAQYSHINRSKLPEAPSSIDDVSSGYMNSLYDESTQQPRPQTSLRTKEKNKKTTKIRPKSMPEPNFDRYSSTEGESIARDGLYTKPLKKPTGKAEKLSGRFKKSGDQRRTTTHEPNSPETDMDPRPPSASVVTSLVSFDPKSGTLLRVREHLDSDEETIYSRRPKEMAVDVGSIYERIREKPSSQKLFADSRSKNCSQDSVPSMIAPILTSSFPETTDSGIASSSTEKWPPPPSKMEPWMGKNMAVSSHWNPNMTSPGIKLSQSENILSPGIRLTTDKEEKSSFQVQATSDPSSSRIVGHYHSTNEFPLVEEETPVLSGPGLLV